MYRNLKRTSNFIIFVILLPFFIACNATQNNSPVYTVISEGSLAAGEAIPLPQEDKILTVSGNIKTTNQDDHIVMDIPTIESVGVVEYTVSVDPFADREIVYQGVLMNDLLDLWQVEEDATTLIMTALNDYQVDVPLELLRDYPVVFALKADGEYMSIADKGPAMLVFPYDHFEFEQPGTNRYWIWQIKSIDVE